MKLAQVLDYYAADTLGAMLHRWEPEAAKRLVRKAERIDALVAILSDPARMSHARWSPAERTLLAVMWEMEPLRLGPIPRLGRALGIANADQAVAGLLACGALLCTEPAWGSKYSEADLGRLADAALAFAPGIVEPPVPEPPSLLRIPAVSATSVRAVRPARGADTAARLMAVVALAGRKKLRVNRDGNLSAAAHDTMVRELGMSDTACVWALGLALVGGLLEEREGVLRPTDFPFARLSLGGLLAAVYAGWFEEGAWPDDLDPDAPAHRLGGPSRHGVFEARPVLFGLLARLQADRWVRVDDLVDAALELDPVLGFRAPTAGFRKPEPPERPSERLAQRDFARGAYVHAAWRLGLVDVGTVSDGWWTPERVEADWLYNRQFREEGRGPRARTDTSLPAWSPPPCPLCVRVTPLGQRVMGLAEDPPLRGAVPGFHVGMDFEIVAPVASTPPELLYRLDLAARALPFGPADPVRRWKLERERWLAALQAGLDGAALLAQLGVAVGRPLPDNVTASVAGWARGYGGVTLFSAHDLVAYPDRAARDAAAALLPGAVAVDERWLVVRQGTAGAGRVLDYRGAPERCLDVGPDGRVTVHPTDDLLVGAELDTLSEVTRDGRRLTAASLKGWRADHALIWLRQRVRVPMTPSTEIAVRGWCGEVPARLQAVDVLQLESADLAAAVAEREEIAPYVAGVLFGGLLVLKTGARAKVVKSLAAIGIAAEDGLRFARP